MPRSSMTASASAESSTVPGQSEHAASSRSHPGRRAACAWASTHGIAEPTKPPIARSWLGTSRCVSHDRG
jgi:hypothetical protein